MSFDFGMRAAARAFLVLLALASASAGVRAQETPAAPAAPTAKPEAPAQNWTVNCTGTGGQAELACTLSQFLVVKESGQRVLTAVVLRREGKTLLNLGLPHGLNLPKGVTVWIDDGAKTSHPILTADQKGSYATIALDTAFVEALKKGTTLHVSVTAFSGDELVLQLSLAGFTAGLAKL